MYDTAALPCKGSTIIPAAEPCDRRAILTTGAQRLMHIAARHPLKGNVYECQAKPHRSFLGVFKLMDMAETITKQVSVAVSSEASS